METSPLICKVNHQTGIYMIVTSVVKEANDVTYEEKAQTSKCPKFAIKTMTLYAEFCVDYVQS